MCPITELWNYGSCYGIETALQRHLMWLLLIRFSIWQRLPAASWFSFRQVLMVRHVLHKPSAVFQGQEISLLGRTNHKPSARSSCSWKTFVSPATTPVPPRLNREPQRPARFISVEGTADKLRRLDCAANKSDCVTPTDLPLPPRNLKISDVTASSVILSWSPSESDDVIKYYVVQYKPRDSAQGYSEISGITTTSHTVTNIKPYTL